MEPNSVRLAKAAGVPVIQVERELASAGSRVLVDSRPGTNKALKHLCNLGHRRITYIGGRPEIDRSEIPARATN